MKTLKTSLLFSGLLLMLVACAKIYYAPDSGQIAKKHKMIAIVPPSVSIPASKKVDAEATKEQQRTESMNFQKEMIAWMLKRKMQGRIFVNILDVETTNAKLRKANYPDSILTPGELCNVLGVDGIITSNYALSKPMSEGAAVAVGLLVGAWGATNQVTVSMSIHDATTNSMFWSYDHKYSGGVGSTPANLVDDLMRKASKKMPYVLNN